MWHLNFCRSERLIRFRASLLITCPQVSSWGGLVLVAGSLVTGHMKMLWNWKDGPRSTSHGNSRAVLKFSLMIRRNLESLGMAYVPASTVRYSGDSSLILLTRQYSRVNALRKPTLCFLSKRPS